MFVVFLVPTKRSSKRASTSSPPMLCVAFSWSGVLTRSLDGVARRESPTRVVPSTDLSELETLTRDEVLELMDGAAGTGGGGMRVEYDGWVGVVVYAPAFTTAAAPDETGRPEGTVGGGRMVAGGLDMVCVCSGRVEELVGAVGRCERQCCADDPPPPPSAPASSCPARAVLLTSPHMSPYMTARAEAIIPGASPKKSFALRPPHRQSNRRNAAGWDLAASRSVCLLVAT